MDLGEHACKMCGDKFSTVRGLNIHMNVHKERFNTPNSTTENSADEAVTANSPKVNEVKAKPIVEDPIFTCQFCLATFKWRYAYYKHLRELHPTPVMEISKPVFAAKTNPIPVSPIQVSSCKICAFEVKSPFAMVSHMKIHGQEPPRKYSCENCSSAFIAKKDLMFHLKEAHQDIPSGHSTKECPKCSQKFISKNLLKKHYHKVHKSTKCPKCKKVFSTRKENKDHYQMKHKKQNQPNKNLIRENESMTKDKTEFESRTKPLPQNESKTNDLSQNDIINITEQNQLTKYETPEALSEKANIELVKKIMANRSWPQVVILPLSSDAISSNKIENGTKEKAVQQPKLKLRSFSDLLEAKFNSATKSTKRKSSIPVNMIPNPGSTNKIIQNKISLTDLPKSPSQDIGSNQSAAEDPERFDSELPDINIDKINSAMSSNRSSSSNSQNLELDVIDFFEMPDIDFLPSEKDKDVSISAVEVRTDKDFERRSNRNSDNLEKESKRTRTDSDKDSQQTLDRQVNIGSMTKIQESMKTNILEALNVANNEGMSEGHCHEQQPSLELLRLTLNQILRSQCQNNNLIVKDTASHNVKSILLNESLSSPQNQDFNKNEQRLSGQSTPFQQNLEASNESANDGPNGGHIASPASTRSSGYQSSFSETSGPSKDSQLSKTCRTDHSSMTTMRPSGSGSKTFSEHESKEHHNVLSSSTKRRGLANFKFRSLSNKLVGSITKLRCLLDNKYTAAESGKNDIYKSFDQVTSNWDDIEAFIEKVLQDEEGVDHLILEAEKLSDSVNALSKEVLKLPQDLRYLEDLMPFVEMEQRQVREREIKTELKKDLDYIS